jgi:hypothetical protein
MGSVTLSDVEQKRCKVIAGVLGGKLAPQNAATLLGCTPRHLRRLIARYVKSGPASLVHGNRGRQPANKTETCTVERIVALAGESGSLCKFNVCHLQDMLEESENIVIGRSTLDRLLFGKAGRLRGSKTKRQHRSRRDRKAAEGELIQTDGSLHLWFGRDHPRCCLIASIDDATGQLIYGHFRPTEDQTGYLRMIHTIAETRGLPMAFYHDKHTILKSPAKITIEDELAGRQPMSQIQRVMHELGVESIAAHSPQAKGRIERLFKTLQDRLCNELALAGITSIDEANLFLPGFIERFNKRFAVQAANTEPVWVPIGKIDHGYFFAVSDERTVRKDHTVSWNGLCLQITSLKSCLDGKVVNIRTDASGEVRIYDQKQRLEFRVVPPALKATKAQTIISAPTLEALDDTKSKTYKGWLYGHV